MPLRRGSYWFSGAPKKSAREVKVVVERAPSGKMAPRTIFAHEKGVKIDLKRLKSRHIQLAFHIPTEYFKELVKKGQFKYKDAGEAIARLRTQIFEIVPSHGDPNLETHGSVMTPISAFENGQGQCFDKASIIVGIARANGFKARILGGISARKDIGWFGHKEHYWAEIYDGTQWQGIDTVSPNIIFDKKKINWKKVEVHEEHKL